MLARTLLEAARVFLRPPKASELTWRAVGRRAVRRWALALFVAVPIGLALAALFERYPDHALTRLAVRLAGGDAADALRRSRDEA